LNDSKNFAEEDGVNICLFDCLLPHEQFFSYMYMAAVTISGDRIANLDLCLAFYVPHLLLQGTSVFKVISERRVILTSKCRAFGKRAIATYFNV
jgi:hypothetical protein